MTGEYLKTYAELGFYTMQGRLSPPEDGRFQAFPRATWATEIKLAPQVPLRGIEWIYDLHGEGINPLETESGRVDLKKRLRNAGVNVVSICADYFMDCPFVRADGSLWEARVEKLIWLINVCPELKITRIVLPFVDASRISGSKDVDKALFALHRALPQAEKSQVEMHLETDLDPQSFKRFLDEVRHPLVKVNYDSGNSASLGYAPSTEFAAYGDRIGSFHIKDRVFRGGTVPLGMGDVDFRSLRSGLIDIEYKGDFVLQVARDIAGEEVSWLRRTATVASSWLRGEKIL